MEGKKNSALKRGGDAPRDPLDDSLRRWSSIRVICGKILAVKFAIIAGAEVIYK